MISPVKILSAIKLDSEILSPEQMEEAWRTIKVKLQDKNPCFWDSCDVHPYKSIECLIYYSDGDVVIGEYKHDSNFEGGGYFKSLKIFDLDNTGKPVCWMRIPDIKKHLQGQA